MTRTCGRGASQFAAVAQRSARAKQGSRARRRGKLIRPEQCTSATCSRASLETWLGGRRHARFGAGELCGGYFLLPTSYSYFRFYCGAVLSGYGGLEIPSRGGRHRGTRSTATTRALAAIRSATVSGLFFRLRPLRSCSPSCVCLGLTRVSSAPQAPGPDFGRASDGSAPHGWCRCLARVRLRLARARSPGPDWFVRWPP